MFPDELVKQIVDERDALRRFKAYVHARLDAAGVPADPDSPHKAEGCRIGGRLDVVLAKYAANTELQAAAEQAFAALVGAHAADDSVQGRARTRLRDAIGD